MTPLVLDANFSPETADFLAATLDLDVTDLISRGLGHLQDEDLVALAKREGRVIVTFDLDLGEIFHRRERGRIGVIILRLSNQTVESVNQALGRFCSGQAATILLERSLVVIDDTRVRITTDA